MYQTIIVLLLILMHVLTFRKILNTNRYIYLKDKACYLNNDNCVFKFGSHILVMNYIKDRYNMFIDNKKYSSDNCEELNPHILIFNKRVECKLEDYWHTILIKKVL